MPQHEPESEEPSNTSPQDPRDESTASRQFFRANAPTVLREGDGPLLSSSPLPERIGHYRIIRIIGEGGMGMVLEAEQDKPKRIVALKVILPGVAKPDMIRRFADESEMLGLLQHPGIAQVYEAGVFDMGGGTQPYFAMEFIRGKPLTEYAREHNLGTRERLQLMIKICEAVQHAHQKGIIHRDLKPSNILVVDDAAESPGTPVPGTSRAPAPGHAQPKILDFGVARLTASDIQSTTLRTDIGQLIGTIPYMSPEQTEGDPRNLDTRSDVYALGVICYELLADRLPYDLQQKMIHEAVRVIREDDPTPLSSVNRVFRGDVETIVAKALEKDRDRRYQSATELASDIERYLKDEPIVARPASKMYQWRKFARRNKALVGGVAATFAMVVAGLVASLYFLNKANVARLSESKALAAVKQRADELEKVSDFQASQLSEIDVTTMGVRLRGGIIEQRRAAMAARGTDETDIQAALRELEQSIAGVNFTNIALDTLDENIFERALKAVEAQFADQPLVRAKLLQSLADTLQAVGLLDRAEVPQQEAYTIRLQVLGEDHPDTLRSLGNLGSLQVDQGNYSPADENFRRALGGFRQVLGNDHRESLSALCNLGMLLQAQGKYDEADKCFRESLDRRRATLGSDHAETLVSLSCLGVLLETRGKLSEAEPFLREAVETYRQTLGNDDPKTLGSLNNLGALLQYQGRLDEAQPLFQEALDTRRRTLGDNHPDTLLSIHNLGGVLQEQGKFVEAEPLFREAEDKCRKLLGPDHPSTLHTVQSLGDVLLMEGKLEEAEPLFREALDARRRILGDSHPDTIVAIGSMGALLWNEGKPAEAEPFFQESLEKCRMLFGEDHPNTLISLNNMGALLWVQGKLRESEPYIRQALEKRRRLLGDTHPDTLNSIHSLGRVLLQLGSVDEAAPLAAEAYQAASAKLAASHPTRKASTLLYGRALLVESHFVEAETKLIEAYELFTASPSSKNAGDQVSKSMVDLYGAWDKSEPGKGYDAKAMEWRAKLAELQTATQPAASQSADSQPASAPFSTPATQSATRPSVKATTQPSPQP